MATQMQAGQRLPLGDAGRVELVVDHAVSDCTVRSALLIFRGALGGEAPVAIVHAGVPSGADGAVELRGQTYRVDLTRLKGRAERVVLVMWVTESDRATAHALSNATRLAVHLKSENSQPIATFAPAPSGFGREAAVIHCEIYDKSGWRLRADGSGFVGGVMPMASRLAIPVALAQEMDGRVSPTPNGMGGGGGAQGPTVARADVLPVRLPRARAHAGRSVPSDLLASMARVYVVAHNGNQYTGTAFAITPGACMVTCSHVVADAAQVAVVFHGDQRPRPCRVLAHDEGMDVALIQPHDANGTEHWIDLAPPGSPTDLGTEVGLLGFPLGQLGEEINYSRGIINSTRKTANGVRMLQVDAGAAPGSSGGPLFHRIEGRVLGVLGGGLRSENMGMHVNLAISVDALALLGWVAP